MIATFSKVREVASKFDKGLCVRSRRGRVKGNVGVVDFFYLFCVGEYTSLRSRQLRQTRQC